MSENGNLNRSKTFLSKSIKSYRNRTIKRAATSPEVVGTSQNHQTLAKKTDTLKIKMSGSRIDSETAEKLRVSEINMKDLDQRMQALKSAKTNKQELSAIFKCVEESRKKLTSTVQSINKLNECLLSHISMKQQQNSNVGNESNKNEGAIDSEKFGILMETFPIIIVLADQIEQLLGDVFSPRFFENQIQGAIEREGILVRSTDSLKATNQCYLQRVKSVCKKGKKGEMHQVENRRFVEEARTQLEMEFENCSKFLDGVFESHQALWHAKMSETRQGLKSALQTALNSMNIHPLTKNDKNIELQKIMPPNQDVIQKLNKMLIENDPNKAEMAIYKCNSSNLEIDKKLENFSQLGKDENFENSQYGDSNLIFGDECLVDLQDNKKDSGAFSTQDNFESRSLDHLENLQKYTHDTDQKNKHFKTNSYNLLRVNDNKRIYKGHNEFSMENSEPGQSEKKHKARKDGSRAKSSTVSNTNNYLTTDQWTTNEPARTLEEKQGTQEKNKAEQEAKTQPITPQSPTPNTNIQIEKPNEHEMQAHMLLMAGNDEHEALSIISSQNEYSKGIAISDFDEKDTSSSKESTNFLYFKKGDRLNVNLKSVANGWVHGQIVQGHYMKEGWFPESFVEIVD